MTSHYGSTGAAGGGDGTFDVFMQEHTGNIIEAFLWTMVFLFFIATRRRRTEDDKSTGGGVQTPNASITVGLLVLGMFFVCRRVFLVHFAYLGKDLAFIAHPEFALSETLHVYARQLFRALHDAEQHIYALYVVFYIGCCASCVQRLSVLVNNRAWTGPSWIWIGDVYWLIGIVLCDNMFFARFACVSIEPIYRTQWAVYVQRRHHFLGWRLCMVLAYSLVVYYYVLECLSIISADLVSKSDLIRVLILGVGSCTKIFQSCYLSLYPSPSRAPRITAPVFPSPPTQQNSADASIASTHGKNE